jgi:hypothetical protein
MTFFWLWSLCLRTGRGQRFGDEHRLHLQVWSGEVEKLTSGSTSILDAKIQNVIIIIDIILTDVKTPNIRRSQLQKYSGPTRDRVWIGGYYNTDNTSNIRQKLFVESLSWKVRSYILSWSINFPPLTKPELPVPSLQNLNPIRWHLNPTNIFISNIHNIHVNIILPSTARSKKFNLQFRFLE